MMDAQHSQRGVVLIPFGALQESREARSHVAPLVREPGQCDADAPNVTRVGSRPIEYVNIRMEREAGVRDPRAFVIPGHDEHRHATLRDTAKRVECLIGGGCIHVGPIEYVASMHDEVDVTRERRLECGSVVREKVMASAPPADARLYRQIKPDICESA